MLSLYQEGVETPYASVECLLNLEQFVKTNSHVNTMYCNSSAVVIADTEPILLSKIHKLLEVPPPVILQYCSKDGILSRMISQVSI